MAEWQCSCFSLTLSLSIHSTEAWFVREPRGLKKRIYILNFSLSLSLSLVLSLNCWRPFVINNGDGISGWWRHWEVLSCLVICNCVAREMASEDDSLIFTLDAFLYLLLLFSLSLMSGSPRLSSFMFRSLCFSFFFFFFFVAVASRWLDLFLRSTEPVGYNINRGESHNTIRYLNNLHPYRER